ncbi:WhiB family transcriptional regulator [Streptomyces sp. NPDC056347]|uniref:WhiB family transcriptional regulator n=1 Tax=Streptomyces sp. NPDC056347 TaxID=3345790 RepID=UPI0035D55A73
MSHAPDTLPRPAEWADRAACIKHGDVFLPPRTERDATPDKALKICAACPVRPECLTAAMEEELGNDQYRRAGVRGGLTPVERARLGRSLRHKGSTGPRKKTSRAEKAERKRDLSPITCGTRRGYQKHRRDGEVACDACRQANADSDRRLRNTGTTKVSTA